MARGDHLKVSRGLYSHHGVDLGDGRVVHYSGLADGLRSGPVRVSSRKRFARGRTVQVVEHGDRDEPEVVVRRALSRLGENRYHLLFRNCEHFACWAVTGRGRSTQVRVVVAAAGAVLLSISTALTTRRLGQGHADRKDKLPFGSSAFCWERAILPVEGLNFLWA